MIILIKKNQFDLLQTYYECKIGIESTKKIVANLEFYARENKKLANKLNEVYNILNEIKFEK